MDALTALLSRRTAQRFLPTPVDAEVLDRCLAAAHQAPCHKHTWPWRFTVVGPEARLVVTAAAIELKSAGKPVSEKQQAFFESQFAHPGALVAVSQVVAADAERAREDYAACAAAIQNLQVAATAHGLHAKWSTGALTRHPEVLRILGLPTGEEVVGLVWVGVGMDPPNVVRPPLTEVVRRVP